MHSRRRNVWTRILCLGVSVIHTHNVDVKITALLCTVSEFCIWCESRLNNIFPVLYFLSCSFSFSTLTSVANRFQVATGHKHLCLDMWNYSIMYFMAAHKSNTVHINKMNYLRTEPDFYYCFFPTDLVSQMRSCGANVWRNIQHMNKCGK